MSRLRWLFASLLALAVVVASTSLLQAHMVLKESQPAANAVLTTAPKTIQISFNEAPDMKVSKMTIKGPSTDVKLTGVHAMGSALMATVQGDMADGPYVVSWQAAGDDGHISKGELAFTVKRTK
jgi:methionine-rich copper-binding protein CopC